MKLVCFGDSLTWGQYGGDYVAALQQKLPDDEVINAGVGGNTILNLLRRVDEDVLRLNPDGVYVMVGGNDAISNVQPATRSYYRQGQGIAEGFVTEDQFETAYRDLLTHLTASHVVTWVGLPPIEYNAAVVAALRRYNGRAREVARSLNISVLDFMDIFPPPEPLPERKPLAIDTILTIGARGKQGWNDYEGARREGGYTFTFDGLHLMPDTAVRMAEHIAALVKGG